MRIAFVIPDLGAGGAERAATLLANEWNATGHDVTLVTFEPRGTEPFFTLDAGIAVRGLAASAGSRGLLARLANNLARVSRLRSVLRDVRPDIVVAFMTEANVVAVWACRGLGVPVVISERNQPDRPGLGPLHRLSRRLTYPQADAIVVQTEEIAAWVRKRFRVPVEVIRNPVRVRQGEPNREKSNAQLLMSLGRLTRQKGFDILVRSFAAIADKHPGWRLVIYGEGPDRGALERLRAESGVKERILLPGLVRNGGRAIAEASLFVLPSRFEGYPNVLLEALSWGLPVIATSCPGASAEILANGVYGKLVAPDDVGAMTMALDEMMGSQQLRQTYAAKARHAVDALDVVEVARRWLDFLAGTRACHYGRP